MKPGEPPTEREGSGRPPPSEDDELLEAGGFIGPGGKVDSTAMRRAMDAAAGAGDGVGGEPAEDDEALRRVVFRLRRDINKRLDKYLTDRITFMSRNQLQRLIEKGGVLVNEKMPKASTVLHLGDVVEVVIPEPPSREIQPEPIPLDVLFEDESIIVINKRPDIITHPARSHRMGTLINALAWRFRHESGGALSSVGKEFARPGVVHRLDRDTSGVMVFAKQDEAHWKLGLQFEHRRVDKRYLAVVQGKLEPDADLIELPIGPHPSREKGYREKYVVRHDEQGRHAVTIFRVRERYRDPRRPVGDQHFTLVELELKTGRTHQIRVHLSYLGFSIVGDDMYGGRAFAGADGRVIIERQALHAALLGIEHPLRREHMVFTAPVRGDMSELVGALRAFPDFRRVDAVGATVDLERAISP
jgi:23S rRNA pseudouridine1911/1915/1917 synthase